MIKVRFKRSGPWHTVEVDGHAGYAANGGPDIVCAGASAVIYTLLGAMRNFASGVAYSDFPGKVKAKCIADDVSDTIFDTAIIGFLQLEKQYPENISVYVKNYKNFPP